MARLTTNPLWITWDNAKKTWIVGFPWTCRIEPFCFYIPMGFESDLASIPRALWWIPGFGPQELGLDAPIVHDYLYQRGGLNTQEDGTIQPITRKQTDDFFLELMKRSLVGPFRRTVAWMAVRAFGWLAWKKAEPTRVTI